MEFYFFAEKIKSIPDRRMAGHKKLCYYGMVRGLCQKLVELGTADKDKG